jgi:arsenite methyltransferase
VLLETDFSSKEKTMSVSEQMKSQVRERYGSIAKQGSSESSCCAPGCCGGSSAPAGLRMNESYADAKGHVPEADLGLGCGLPLNFAALQPGEKVLDLGSGAGNDAFVAAAEVGAKGEVIGVDMTPEMVSLARRNAERRNVANVSFRLGELEHMPVDSHSVDVVISNCVVNLVPNKPAVFGEMARVLKPGGRFILSDIVVEGEMAESLRQVVELYAGCVGGAVATQAYVQGLKDAGFADVSVAESKPYPLDAASVQPYLPSDANVSALLKGFTIHKVIVTGKQVSGL